MTMGMTIASGDDDHPDGSESSKIFTLLPVVVVLLVQGVVSE